VNLKRETAFQNSVISAKEAIKSLSAHAQIIILALEENCVWSRSDFETESKYVEHPFYVGMLYIPFIMPFYNGKYNIRPLYLNKETINCAKP